MNIHQVLFDYADQPLSTSVLLALFKGYKRPYDKIMDLVEKGYLIQLRRGLYITTDKVSSKSPEPFLLANHLYGPSYVSLDAAMYYHGLIPERTFEVSSVTIKASAKFQIQNTVYSYVHLPAAYYPIGIESVELAENQNVLMASAGKSVCDKIITTTGINLRSKKQAMGFLVDDLRIEKDRLREFNLREMLTWLPAAPKQESLKNFIEAVAEL